jgi:hypothetical protein
MKPRRARDDTMSPEMRDEIMRRAEVVRRGASMGRPVAEVLAAIRAKLATR